MGDRGYYESQVIVSIVGGAPPLPPASVVCAQRHQHRRKEGTPVSTPTPEAWRPSLQPHLPGHSLAKGLSALLRLLLLFFFFLLLLIFLLLVFFLLLNPGKLPEMRSEAIDEPSVGGIPSPLPAPTFSKMSCDP